MVNMNQEIQNILRDGHCVVLQNGLPKYGNTGLEDMFAIHEKDLLNYADWFRKNGYFFFDWMGNKMVIKLDNEEIISFARTPEMMEMFKNWKEWTFPPELIRLLILTKSSKKGRLIIDEELTKRLIMINKKEYNDALETIEKYEDQVYERIESLRPTLEEEIQTFTEDGLWYIMDVDIWKNEVEVKFSNNGYDEDFSMTRPFQNFLKQMDKKYDIITRIDLGVYGK